MRKISYFLLILFATYKCSAQWSQFTPLPTQKYLSMNTMLNGVLYSFGGVGDLGGSITSETQTAWRYTSNKWQSLKNLPFPRSAGYAAAINDKIYIAGGSYSIGNNLKRDYNYGVLRFDPVANKYDSIARFQDPVRHVAGAVVDNKMILVGGEVLFSDGVRLKEVDENTLIFDPEVNDFTTIAGPYKCAKAASAVIDNTIYVVGGSDDENQYLKTAYKGTYDFGEITWKRIADLPVGTTLASAGISKGKFFLAGGSTGKGYVNTVYYYDDNANKWSTSYALPKANMQSSCNMPGDGTAIYYISGFANNEIYKFIDGGLAFPVGIISDTTILSMAKVNETDTFYITLSNGGATSLQGNINTGAEWLTANKTSVDIAPGTELKIRFITKSPTAGNFKTTLKFGSNEKDRTEIPVTVRFYARNTLTPQKTKLLVEEVTSTGNGDAKDADTELKDLLDSYGDEIVIAQYHISSGTPADNLKTAEGDALVAALGAKSLPVAAFNRLLFPSKSERLLPRDEFENWNGWAGTGLEMKTEAAIKLTLDEYSYDDGDQSVNLNLGVESYDPLFASNQYFVTAITTESNIRAAQLVGSATSSVYFHNNVVRAIAPEALGLAVNFQPSSIEDGVVLPASKTNVKFSFNANVKDATRGKLIVFIHRNVNGKPAEIIQTITTDLQPELIDKPFDVIVRTSTKNATSGDTVIFNSQISNKINQSYPMKISRKNSQLPYPTWSTALGNLNDYSPTNIDLVSYSLTRLDTLWINLKVFAGEKDGFKGQGKVTLKYESPIATPSSVIEKIFTLNADGKIVSVNEEKVVAGISPNPLRNQLKINFNKDHDKSKIIIGIYDINSKIVYSKLLNNYLDNNVTLDLSNLSIGTYILKVTNGNSVSTEKIVIQK